MKLAEAYGHVGMEIKDKADLEPAMREAFAMKDKLVFLDISLGARASIPCSSPNGAMKDMWLSKTERT